VSQSTGGKHVNFIKLSKPVIQIVESKITAGGKDVNALNG
jgi:hypothetical protein